MQQDLDENYPLLNIDLLGVNEHNQAFANSAVTAGRTLPWLQDTDADQDNLSDVWTEQWQVQWRDVVILNGANEKVGVYNLTSHNLGTPAAYNELRGMLLDAAMLTQKLYQNPDEPLDVDDNGAIQALDVLLVVNDLNISGNGKFTPISGTQLPTVFYDCNGDNIRGPADALAIINFINARTEQSNEGEGEEFATLKVSSAVDFAALNGTDSVHPGSEFVVPAEVLPDDSLAVSVVATELLANPATATRLRFDSRAVGEPAAASTPARESASRIEQTLAARAFDSRNKLTPMLTAKLRVAYPADRSALDLPASLPLSDAEWMLLATDIASSNRRPVLFK